MAEAGVPGGVSTTTLVGETVNCRGDVFSANTAELKRNGVSRTGVMVRVGLANFIVTPGQATSDWSKDNADSLEEAEEGKDSNYYSSKKNFPRDNPKISSPFNRDISLAVVIDK